MTIIDRQQGFDVLAWISNTLNAKRLAQAWEDYCNEAWWRMSPLVMGIVVNGASKAELEEEHASDFLSYIEQKWKEGRL